MASGCYRYILNGHPTEVAESWSLEGELATQCQISSRRSAPGVEIEVTAAVSSGTLQHFTTLWRSGSAGTISAEYLLQRDRVLVTWRAAGRGNEEVIELFHDTVSSQPLLFPLMRIFTGPLIARLLQLGGEGKVILPDINDPEDEEHLLRPLTTQRRARVIEKEALLLCNGVELRCRRCEYTGDQYRAGSQFWLGEDDLLLRYQWQQSADQHWDVLLQWD